MQIFIRMHNELKASSKTVFTCSQWSLGRKYVPKVCIVRLPEAIYKNTDHKTNKTFFLATKISRLMASLEKMALGGTTSNSLVRTL